MARVIGNPLGELRGKLAGMVFSKNAAGPIVRQYVIPTNPNTWAQTSARALFRVSVMTWKSFSQLIQQGWEVFAKNTFVPLRKVNVGQYTGQQACNAILMSGRFCVSRGRVPTWVAVPPGVDPICVAIPFVLPSVAPLFSVVPNIAQLTKPPATMTFDTFVVSNTGQLEFRMLFQGTPVGGLDANEFIDSNGTPFSFAVYISDPVNQFGNRPKNQFYQRLCNANLCTFPVANLNGLIGVTLGWNFAPFIPTYKSFPVPGSICKITIVCIGQNGTQAVAGSGYVTIT